MPPEPEFKIRSKVPSPTEAAGIPKIIHQVFFPGKPPAVIQENVDRIKAQNPGWQHRLYDDNDMADFIGSTYGSRLLTSYCRINKKYGAARADYFRYLLMHEIGGVYLDIKSCTGRPLDEVIRTDDIYLLSRWRNAEGETYEGWGMHRQLEKEGGNEFQQWHIISVPGHGFLRGVIEKVYRNIETYDPLKHDTGKNGVLQLTGPIAYTQAITPLLSQHSYRIVDSQNELAFEYSIFGSPGDRAHKAIFKLHYTDLKEPVATLTGSRKLMWIFFGPVRNMVIQPIRDFVDAVVRKFTAKPVRRG
jgi:hypothetical protein